MRKLFLHIGILFCVASAALPTAAQTSSPVDTIDVSSIYTTHILFPTDLVYADISNKTDIMSMIVENSRNIIAIQAARPFKNTCNVTAMESNGTLRTYILRYAEFPQTLVIDEKHQVYFERPDTIAVSSQYTSHLVYSSNIIYPHLSNAEFVVANVVPKAENILAVSARRPFGNTPRESCNIAVMEADGYLHTYIVTYQESPAELVLNYQRGERKSESGTQQVVSLLRKTDAPQLETVLQYPQSLFHLSTRKNKISVTVENIFSYSDITYITIRIDNRSGVSFEAGKTAFDRISKPKFRNSIIESEPIIPRASIGTLTAAPGSTSKMIYTFDKITLPQDQIFRISVYEEGGNREYFLDLTPKDINEAEKPLP